MTYKANALARRMPITEKKVFLLEWYLRTINVY